MRIGKRRRSIIGYKWSLMPIVKGILRMGIGRYGLELQKRLLGILSDIYYRIYYCYITISSIHQLQGKITVQVDATRRAIILVVRTA